MEEGRGKKKKDKSRFKKIIPSAGLAPSDSSASGSASMQKPESGTGSETT